MLGRVLLRRPPLAGSRRLGVAAFAAGGPRSRAFASAGAPDAAASSARAKTLAAAAAAAATAVLLLGTEQRQRVAFRCEEAPEAGGSLHEVSFTTYNVLSPPLCTASHFPKCAKEDTEHQNRLPKLLRRLTEETANGAVIGLQEVDLSWAGKLHAFFAEHNYSVVFAQYGKPFNGYMGVMMAWPMDRYEVLDVEIARISDTAPKGTFKGEKGETPPMLAPFGYLTYSGLKEVLGCKPPELREKQGDFDTWKMAQNRFNEAIFVRLKARDKKARPFCVATYHMPCLFGAPAKVQVVNIHAYLLLGRLKTFAAGDPAVLMGDFNFKPGTSPYVLTASGGNFTAAAEAPGGAAEVEGLEKRLPPGPLWPLGLGSAYKDFYKKEPLFTNFAQTEGMHGPFVETLDYIWYTPGALRVVHCQQLPQTREEARGPFPNRQEPSDHLPLRCSMRLSGA